MCRKHRVAISTDREPNLTTAAVQRSDRLKLHSYSRVTPVKLRILEFAPVAPAGVVL